MSTELANEKERHISVDPISMKEVVEYSSSGAPKPKIVDRSLPSLPKKNKFLSASLPSSACSSPRSVINSKAKTIYQDEGHEKGSTHSASLGNQHSLALSRLISLRESRLQRSKSCGEGRPSIQYDEFDLRQTTPKSTSSSISTSSADSTPRGQTTSLYNDDEYKKFIVSEKQNEEEFKCGALCLFLPGFGKGKPVRSRREQGQPRELGHVISHRVSLEKFECGSWRSSGVMNGSDFSSNMYFDLPLELIQTSGNDANLPVNSAFVFDKDLKGVLKTKGAGGERKSTNDRRHVRFSTSSPTTSPSSSVTPRMHKAQDDFSSYLEAQNA
ncbi:uncharacterized protein [Rutidosis leptorrhynchoides]|uniref:uncharacterized protein n=1 Tax=Rutidosis leptorrhynchoides TaxID=125765 RepID=UPI003A9A0ECA